MNILLIDLTSLFQDHRSFFLGLVFLLIAFFINLTQYLLKFKDSDKEESASNNNKSQLLLSLMVISFLLALSIYTIDNANKITESQKNNNKKVESLNKEVTNTIAILKEIRRNQFLQRNTSTVCIYVEIIDRDLEKILRDLDGADYALGWTNYSSPSGQNIQFKIYGFLNYEDGELTTRIDSEKSFLETKFQNDEEKIKSTTGKNFIVSSVSGKEGLDTLRLGFRIDFNEFKYRPFNKLIDFQVNNLFLNIAKNGSSIHAANIDNQFLKVDGKYILELDAGPKQGKRSNQERWQEFENRINKDLKIK